jgi:GTP cyclohydrolase I
MPKSKIPTVEPLPNSVTPDFNKSHDYWHKELTKAFAVQAKFLGRRKDLSESDLANMEESPARAAKAFMEMTDTKTHIRERVKEIIATGFPLEPRPDDKLVGMLTQGPIHIVSVCPHHWLPVEYEAFVSYIPVVGGTVIGLSKLARLALTLGKRPVLQEQLASDIADVLFADPNVPPEDAEWPSIQSSGAIVSLIGKHSCMSCRGVLSDALTMTVEKRGDFWVSQMEQRFYDNVSLIHKSRKR